MILAAATDSALTIHALIWLRFLGAVLVFRALDLGVFHSKPRAVNFGEALLWPSLWF